MSSALRAPVVVLVVALGAGRASADPCVQTDRLGAFAVCFDLGNRLALAAGTRGFGGEIDVRHRVRVTDSVLWRLEHRGFATTVGYPGLDPGYTATLHEGRYTYHVRDGRLTIPAARRAVHLPFDVGAESLLLRVTGRTDSTRAQLRVIQAGAFVDFARAATFGRRLAIGTGVSWEMDVDGGAIDVLENRVSPFSTVFVDAYAETRNGLTRAHLRVEAGARWSDISGWHRTATATTSLERVVLSIQDRPLTLYAEATWTDPGDVTATIGARFALLGSRPWSQTFKQAATP